MFGSFNKAKNNAFKQTLSGRTAVWISSVMI